MNMLNKVPAVTLIFWIIKIMATTVGETAADFLAFNLKLGLTNTSLLMAGLLVVAAGTAAGPALCAGPALDGRGLCEYRGHVDFG